MLVLEEMRGEVQEPGWGWGRSQGPDLDLPCQGTENWHPCPWGAFLHPTPT